jgi:hypothetical protein
VPSIVVGLRQRGGFAPAQEVALDVMHATLFDLALMLGCAYPTRIDEETVVLGKFAVGLLHLWIILAGPQNCRLEIVQHHPLWHTAKKLKGMAMAQQPGGQFLVEDKLDVLVAAP